MTLPELWPKEQPDGRSEENGFFSKVTHVFGISESGRTWSIVLSDLSGHCSLDFTALVEEMPRAA
jgi:hypothetical protein